MSTMNLSLEDGSSTTHILVAFALIALSYALSLAVYRLYLHPLSSFPGPKIAAATKWYEFFYDVCVGEGGQYAWKIQEMHEKYGPIVRINPHELHIHDPSYYNILYAPSPARRDKYPPAAQMAGAPHGSFGTVDHFEHRKRRAANSPLFAVKAVSGAQSLIEHRVSLLGDLLEEKAKLGEPFKIHTPLLAFTTDVMFVYMLGKPLGCQENYMLAEQWGRTTNAIALITPMVKQFPWIIRAALKLPVSVVRALLPNLSLVVIMQKMLHSEARQHKKQLLNKDSCKNVGSWSTQTPPTIFEVIERSNLPEAEKSASRMAQEAFVVMTAGTETTARTLANIIYHVVANPEILSKLREELGGVPVNTSAALNLNELQTLPFLTAVIKEGLRVMQLITSRLPIMPHNELHYKEWTIPAKTPVSLTINEVLYDESIFPEPRNFLPARWLDSKGQLHNDLDAYFVPFGRGTRMCQGMNFAWAEMYVCLARLIDRFDFELYKTERSRDVDVSRDCFIGTTVSSSLGIRVTVKRRGE